MEDDLHVACDERGFLWTRTVTSDFERPHPAFPPISSEDPVTGVIEIIPGGTGETGGPGKRKDMWSSASMRFMKPSTVKTWKSKKDNSK